MLPLSQSTKSIADEEVSIIEPPPTAGQPTGYQVIQLDQERARQVLAPQPEWTHNRPVWNHDLLERLEAIDSYARQFFTKREDVIDRVKLRLVKPDGVAVDEDRPKYDCLSYSWHNPSWNAVPELVDRDVAAQADRATAPLHSQAWRAVLAESARAKHVLWVDSLCIDQENGDEKKVTVGFMDRIYQNASRVFIVLEDVCIEERWIRSLSACTDLHPETAKWGATQKLQAEDYENLFDLMTAVFRCRWSQRAWCQHELMMSLRQTLIIPIRPQTKDAELRFLLLPPSLLRIAVSAANSFPTMVAMLHLEKRVGRKDWLGPASARGVDFISRSMRRNVVGNFVEATTNTFGADARYANDKLSIVLNAVSSGLMYTGPMVESAGQLFQLVYSIALAAGDGMIFGVESPYGPCQGRFTSTWCMLPEGEGNLVSDRKDRDRRVGKFSCSVSRKGSLKLEVVFLAQVDDVQMPQQRYLDAAQAFMNQDFTDITDALPFHADWSLQEKVSQLQVTSEDDFAQSFKENTGMELGDESDRRGFYAQALAALLALRDHPSFWQIFNAPNSPIVAFNVEDLEAVFVWLGSWAQASRSSAWLGAPPLHVSDEAIKAMTELIERFVRWTLRISIPEDATTLHSWEDYTVGILHSPELPMSPVPMVLAKHCEDGFVVVPADVKDEYYANVKRLWVLDGCREAGDDETFTLAYKTMLPFRQDVHGDATEVTVV